MKDGRKVKNITGLSKGNRKGLAKMDFNYKGRKMNTRYQKRKHGKIQKAEHVSVDKSRAGQNNKGLRCWFEAVCGFCKSSYLYEINRMKIVTHSSTSLLFFSVPLRLLHHVVK